MLGDTLALAAPLLPVQIADVEAALHGPQDDVLRHQVERAHLLLRGERRQQTAVHRVNMDRVLALWARELI